MTISNRNVAIIGCGRMGSALVRGAVRAGALDPARLYCIDAHDAAALSLAGDVGAQEGPPPTGEPTIWIVAVKPGDLADALGAHAVSKGDIVISVAAGVPVAKVQRAAGPGVAVVRSMPNTPALVGEGITGIHSADDGALGIAEALFSAVGEVVTIAKESQFDAVTALSGSGPAYVFVAIEALADGGVKMGLDRATATKLALETVRGSAALAASEGVHVAELKDRVASPGGTTIAGLSALERAGFRSALIDAVEAATLRGRELGEE